MTSLRPMPSLLDPQDWSFPVPIAYGPGRIKELPEKLRALQCAAPLIVTDSGSRDLPFITQALDLLKAAGMSPGLFSDVSPNPRDTEIGAGVAVYLDAQHDSIIAIGGGSGMDGAKAIGMMVAAHFSAAEIDLWDFEWEKPLACVDAPFPTLITIPTTAGTGAETEATPMITDTVKAMKFCLAHPGFKPSLVILDPELTVNLPPRLTAWTGADALTHALEAYLVQDFHPLCDGAALQALSLISKWLPIAHQEPQNVEARGGMLVGSCLAGVAFLKGLGLVHAISHMIGAEYDTQHGLTNAIVLPVVLAHNLPAMEEKARQIAQAMDLSSHSPEDVLVAVSALLDRVEIPTSLTEIGVPSDCAEAIAKKAILDSAASTNPLESNIPIIAELISRALTKAR